MRILETELAVVGAGPAGLSAAYQVASAGAEVLVLDENRLPGGQLFKQIHKFFGSRDHQAGTRGYVIGQQLLEKVGRSGARVWLDSTVYGMEKDCSLGVIHEGEPWVVRAGKVIVAAGARENCMAFPGSTLPGVMGAGAAQTMVNVNRVLPGRRVLMVGSGNVGLIVSYQLLQAGAEVAAVVEGAPLIGGYGVHAAKLRRAGVPFYTGHTVKAVTGEGQVEHCEIVQVDRSWNQIPGTEKGFDVDTVCLAVGLTPMTELLWMAGCQFCWIPSSGGHVPLHDENMETTVPGLYVAGDVTGVEEASSAMEEGSLAGVAAAAALGHLTSEEADRKMEEIRRRLDMLRSGMFGEGRRRAKDVQLAGYADWKEGGAGPWKA